MNATIVNSTDLWDNVTAAPALSEFPASFQRLNVGVRMFEGLLAVVTNSLTILAVFKYEFLRTNTNLLICNLAAADLIGGLSPIFLLAHFNLQANVQRWLVLCTIEMTLNIMSSGLNIMAIMWVSLDRFMYINFPLRYYTLVQTSHVWAAIGISWLWNVFQLTLASSFGMKASEDLVCRSPTLYVNQTVFANFVNVYFGISTVIIFILYGRIAFVAHKQARSIGPQMDDAVTILSKAETKITKMMALILGLYFCCYIPQITSLIIIRALDDPPQWMSMTERAMAWIWWVNSWMNPFIYAWKSRQFNRGFKLLLGLKAVPPSPSLQVTHTH